MFDAILKSGGIPSICSAHPEVLRAALDSRERSDGLSPVLVESTCNQVNQYGGYTGMRPEDFVRYVRGLAQAQGFPLGKLILGGDHLGPNVWQMEPSTLAMQKSEELLRAYVRAGYTKLHLDCSMRLADDPAGPLDPELVARRAARLALAAEEAYAQAYSLPAAGQGNPLRYVIGTEVPVPGGATAHEEGVRVTQVEDVRETLDLHRKAFSDLGLEQAWERVRAVVVQPGVEFGDDFVLPYRPENAGELAAFIEGQGMVYEAHSTDYQTRSALRNLVRDHFAILKVGPGLTFAYREAIFSLALMEQELVPAAERSDLFGVLEAVMLRRPEHWQKYYQGSPAEQAFKRKYSLSDRIRYYWAFSEVQEAVETLVNNLSQVGLPLALVSQYAPQEKAVLLERGERLIPQKIIRRRITAVLEDYWAA